LNVKSSSTPSAAPRRTPFWLTPKGALVAVIALHFTALATLVTELIAPLGGAHHGEERVAALEFFGSYALFGFVACVVLVLLGRALRRLVIRDESYYEEGP
jgi:hypothetical protein